jgi:hypothetical protein
MASPPPPVPAAGITPPAPFVSHRPSGEAEHPLQPPSLPGLRAPSDQADHFPSTPRRPRCTGGFGAARWISWRCLLTLTANVPVRAGSRQNKFCLPFGADAMSRFHRNRITAVHTIPRRRGQGWPRRVHQQDRPEGRAEGLSSARLRIMSTIIGSRALPPGAATAATTKQNSSPEPLPARGT